MGPHRSALMTVGITQRYAHVDNYSDLPSITIQQIEHFFAHYKDLEPNKWVKIVRWGDADEARTLVLEGIQRAKKAKTIEKAKS
jgi:inorganic pyrophosphatase